MKSTEDLERFLNRYKLLKSDQKVFFDILITKIIESRNEGTAKTQKSAFVLQCGAVVGKA